ncbi:MAG: glycoside hydrolase [Planctomycetia bacterium]|nr:glycoside hydrolase [Planctomycetia bacterium]
MPQSITRLMSTAFVFLILNLSTSVFSAEDQWSITPKDSAWSRTKDALTVIADSGLVYQGKTAAKIVHTADTDWAIRAAKRIPVKPGEVFEISCLVKGEEGEISTGVITYKDQEAISWIYGGTGAFGSFDWKDLHSKFIVPPGVNYIEPRLTGSMKGTVWFSEYTVKRIGFEDLTSDSGTESLENSFFSVDFNRAGGTFSVRDKRTNRKWNQIAQDKKFIVRKTQKIDPQTLKFSLFNMEQFRQYKIEIKLARNVPEMIVKIDSEKDTPMSGTFAYPLPFEGTPGDRAILPVNEGISFPVEEQKPGLGNFIITYGGHGLCMSFFGQIKDEIDPEKADGYLAIIHTPDDAGVVFYPRPNTVNKELTLAMNPGWIAQKQKFGYERSVRYVFFDKGGHVALCKRYREDAKRRGLYVPFTEKIRKNPNLKEGIDLLIGAANIWSWGGNRVNFVKDLKAAGIDRILWSGGGEAKDLAEMNQLGYVLTSRYDIYQDLMDPSLLKEAGIKNPPDCWTQDAWPHDIAWKNENGTIWTGWSIDNPDKTKPRIPCAVLCARTALPYAEKRIGNELKTKPYKARFLDTTVASSWRECWHPDHPMTRTDCKNWRMKLLELLGKRFDLVCGSETGHEASVPYCDFYEGMMSLGPYRVPESGRYLEKIWNDPPERLVKYQTGESFRLPLWELVYHDCTVSYWYWGDYNNKLPTLWRKRDLFNALYGVPPMYLFSKDSSWDKLKEKFVASYKVAEPVSRLTGYSEMTDHRILSKDRTVQQTEFANGCRVIVNFGSNPFTLPDGSTINANDLIIKQ